MNTSYREVITQDVCALVRFLSELQRRWSGKMVVLSEVSVEELPCSKYVNKVKSPICYFHTGAYLQYTAWIEDEAITHREISVCAIRDEDDPDFIENLSLVTCNEPSCSILPDKTKDWLMCNIGVIILRD